MLIKIIAVILLLSKTVLSQNTTISSVSVSESTMPYGEVDIESRRAQSKRPSLNITSNATANIEQVRKGRYIRKYEVVTCDGYILTVMRLTSKIGEVPTNYTPVLLVHGMFQSSDIFIEQSEDRSLAFKLYDLGYDVWLANTRGNRYSREHIYLDPDSDDNKEFFDYDYEEIGIYDISVTVDYILNGTNKLKLHYIGYSLGGTVFLVLNSLNPEYNIKFASAHLMAPIGYQNNFPNKNLTDEVSRQKEIYQDLLTQGNSEIFPTKTAAEFSEEYCLGNNTYKNICCELNIYDNMGVNNNNNDKYHTRGGSIKELAHLAQNIISKEFSRWNYGKEIENEKIYGAKVPPLYNLSLVTTSTTIYYAQNDEYVSPKDIIDMAKDMGNATTKKVPRVDFLHQDFMNARDVMDNVYAEILKDFQWNNKQKLLNQLSGETTSTGFPWTLVLVIGGICILLLIILCVIVQKKKRNT